MTREPAATRWNLHACTPRAAQHLLLTAVLADDTSALDAWRQWRDSEDFDAVDSASFRLLPMIYLRLKDLDATDPLLPRLQRVYRHTWFRNQRLFSQARSLLVELEAAGIDSLLLKGGAMSARYYRDAGERFMQDLDLLVRPAQFSQAMQCLAAGDWQINGSSAVRLGWLFRLGFLHGASFRRGGAEVDLHAQLSRFVWQDDDLLWGSARSVQWQGRTVRVPASTFALYHCCVHGVRWSHAILSWIPDAMQILRDTAEPVDWPLLLQLAEQGRTVIQLRHALAYLADVWAAPVPAAVLQALSSAPCSWVERAEYAQLARVPERGPAVLLRRLWLRSCRYRQAGSAAHHPIRPSLFAWLAYLVLYGLAPVSSRD